MNSSVPPPQGLAGRPRIRFIDVFGHRVRVAIWSGPEGATPLLMLNGICARIELIAPLAEAVAEGREVVSYEFPGAGESAPPRLPYTMSMAAAFTARLLRTLGYTTVDVLGVSWGEPSPSNSHCSIDGDAESWCWPRRLPASRQSPGAREPCANCALRDVSTTPLIAGRSRATCTAAMHAQAADWSTTWNTDTVARVASATCSNSWP